MREALAGWPAPPAESPLLKRELPFWHAIVRARLPGEWAKVDLTHAVTLARALSDIEVQRAKIRREGEMLRNKVTGTAQLNPRLALVQQLTSRSMSLTRVLCLHARITLSGGEKDKQAEAKAAAAQADAAVDAAHAAHVAGHGDDDLIARPRLQ